MCFFVVRNKLQVVEVLCVEPSLLKLLQWKSRESAFVKDIFKMFKLEKQLATYSLEYSGRKDEPYSQSKLQHIQVRYATLLPGLQW